MLYIDKLLEDRETFGIDSLDFNKVLPVMVYLEDKGITWFSGHKPTELYKEEYRREYLNNYVVVTYSEWKNRICCGTHSQRDSSYDIKWVTPRELFKRISPGAKIKRGFL